MTNDEKAKAYDMALEAARKELGCDRKEYNVVEQVLCDIFPELRESDGERARRWLVNLVENLGEPADEDAEKELEVMRPLALSYLEKQKEQKDYRKLYEDIAKSEWFKKAYEGKSLGEPASSAAWKDEQKEQKPISSYDIVPYIDDKIASLQDMWREEKVAFDWDDMKDMIEDVARHFYQKEQKPDSTEDMPYVADEHFFEREPADSFKYRLAEYMTKNCKKGEGPYGYTYGISSESILQMAKDELIKRGELKEQKPVEWKPTEEQMNALNFAITYFMHETNYKNPTELRDLYDDLLKLQQL